MPKKNSFTRDRDIENCAKCGASLKWRDIQHTQRKRNARCGKCYLDEKKREREIHNLRQSSNVKSSQHYKIKRGVKKND